MSGTWCGKGRVVRAEVLVDDSDKKQSIRKGMEGCCRKLVYSQIPLKFPKVQAFIVGGLFAPETPHKEKNLEIK